MVKKVSTLILLFCICLQSCAKKENKELQKTEALANLQRAVVEIGGKLQQDIPQTEITAELPEEFVVKSGRLMRYKGKEKDVIIPDGISVIEKEAFVENEVITSVRLPEGVTSIQNSAFSGCSNLKEVVVPDTLAVIGQSAFWRCVSLENIDLHAVKKIYSSAFYGCKNLKVINLESVEELGEGVFESAGVQEITGMVNIEKVGGGILEDTPVYEKYLAGEDEFFICGALLVSGQNADGEVKIPEGIRVVLSRAFRGNHQITSVTFPDTVWKIGNSAFDCCFGLEKIDMTDSVVQLGEGAFSYCCKLQQIRLSKRLGRIPSWCFAGCDIREITIPQGCSLADGAFYYCTDTKWTFPPDAKNLGNLFYHIDAEDDLEDNAEEFNRNESCFYTTDLSNDVFLVRIAREQGWKLETLQLEITDLTMHVGEEYVLRFNSGADAVWKLDDDNVLSLEEGEFFGDRKLIALREGTTVVAAEIYGVEYTCKVKVVE